MSVLLLLWRNEIEGLSPPGQIRCVRPIVVSAVFLYDEFLGLVQMTKQIKAEANGKNFVVFRADDADRMLKIFQIGNGVVFGQEKQWNGYKWVMRGRRIGQRVPRSKQRQSADRKA